MNAITIGYWSSLVAVLLLVSAQQDLANGMKMGYCQIYSSELPENVIPVHYKLLIRIDRRMNTFEGEVQILSQITISNEPNSVASDPKKIILNVKDLIVQNVMFKQDKGLLDMKSFCYDASREMLEVTLSENMKEGGASLDLSFTGIVNAEAKGLFRSFVDSGKIVLATQFKPNFARRLFPCFDEPRFKATFKLAITHPLGTIALSNMKGVQDPFSGPFTTTRFLKTPRMSSYLLSLAVGNLKSNSKSSLIYGTKIAIYTPRDTQNQVSEMLKKAMQAYEKVACYFNGLTQTQESIDIVAVNMEPIAVESWGLITMRWDFLYASALNAKCTNWIRAINTLTTKMIHQRLGNVITMRSWDDMWLQEGIAAHLASELTSRIRVDIGIRMHTLLDTNLSAMTDDQDPQKARPIKKGSLTTEGQFDAAFDLFTYKKSTALVGMFASLFGDRHFETTIRNFIRLHAEKGLVDAGDWWSILSRDTALSSGMQEVVRQWTEQVGYPTISVDLYDEHTLLVKQLPELANGQVWSVPILFELENAAGDKETTAFLLSDLQYHLTLPSNFNIHDEDCWLKFNPHYQGYYRVVYLHRPIIYSQFRAIKLGKMPPADRLQLLSDIFADANRRDYFVDFENILSNMGKETEDGIILLLIGMLTEIGGMKLSPDSRKQAAKLMSNYHALNGGVWREPSSNYLKQCTREQVLNYLVNTVQDQDVIEELRKIITSTAPVPPFLQSVFKKRRGG